MRGIIVRVELYEGCACGGSPFHLEGSQSFSHDDNDGGQYKISLNNRIAINFVVVVVVVPQYLSVFIFGLKNRNKKLISPVCIKIQQYS